jgi:hypothetical protein
VWVKDNALYLGHDSPTWQVDRAFLQNDKFWIHAKNLDALQWLATQDYQFNYFWHESDQYTLTSKQFIWAYPGMSLTKNCIMVMPEFIDPLLAATKSVDCYAICSDYIDNIVALRNHFFFNK